MENKKVLVLTRFDLRGKSYPPGEALVPEDKVEGLRAKGLIAPESETPATSMSGSTLESELVTILSNHAGESGENEGATQTLRRLIAERNHHVQMGKHLFNTNTEIAERNTSLSAENTSLHGENLKASQLVAAMHQAAVGSVRAPIRGVVEDVEDVRKRAEAAESLLAEIGNGGSKGADANAPTKDESENTGSAVEVATTPETQGTSVQGTPVTAEQLTEVLGTSNAKSALALLGAGFNTREKLNAATNAELDAVPQVTGASVQKLRDWLKG